MTLAHLARSNIRGSLLRYAAFFLSSTFSVLLFFTYAQFLLHPAFDGGYLYGGSTTRTVLQVCMVLIAVFAFFFVLYSSGAFLRARNQEFGLLTLMGTTRAQLRRLVWLENTLLSLAAIGAGMGAGLLLSKLFLLAISRVLALPEPIPFAFVPRAMLLTGAAFFLLFQVVTVVSAARLGRVSVIELLRAARRPRVTPRASVLLAVLGLLLVVGGYVGAASAAGEMVVVAFLPTVTVVVVGTYLMFLHGSLFVLRRMQRHDGGYLRGTRMVVVSQLVFRMRDNARLLATIATLSAVVLSAAGTFYVVTSQLSRDVAVRFEQPLALLEPATGHGHLTALTVDALFAEHGVTPDLHVELPLVGALVTDGDGPSRAATFVARSAVEELADQAGTAPAYGEDKSFAVAELHALGNVAAPDTDGFDAAAYVAAKGSSSAAGEPGLGSAVFLAREVDPPVTQVATLWGTWYAVDDAELAALAAAGPGTALERLVVYDWAGAARPSALAEAIIAATPPEHEHLVADRFRTETQIRQTLGLSMFTGVFVSLLFFIGAGSLIYFKLFTELPSDRRLFTRLRRIGITRRETDGVVTQQIATVFMVPFIVGGVHAVVALNALGNLLEVNVAGYSALVVALFAAVQLTFLALTRWTYLRALLPAR